MIISNFSYFIPRIQSYTRNWSISRLLSIIEKYIWVPRMSSWAQHSVRRCQGISDELHPYWIPRYTSSGMQKICFNVCVKSKMQNMYGIILHISTFTGNKRKQRADWRVHSQVRFYHPFLLNFVVLCLFWDGWFALSNLLTKLTLFHLARWCSISASFSLTVVVILSWSNFSQIKSSKKQKNRYQLLRVTR